MGFCPESSTVLADWAANMTMQVGEDELVLYYGQELLDSRQLDAFPPLKQDVLLSMALSKYNMGRELLATPSAKVWNGYKLDQGRSYHGHLVCQAVCLACMLGLREPCMHNISPLYLLYTSPCLGRRVLLKAISCR